MHRFNSFSDVKAPAQFLKREVYAYVSDEEAYMVVLLSLSDERLTVLLWFEC